MTSFRKSYTFIAFLLLHSFKNKKNILWFINAFKHRGLQNELFMNIQIRLCPLIRKKDGTAFSDKLSRGKKKKFFQECATLGNMLFFYLFSLSTFCFASRKDNMMTFLVFSLRSLMKMGVLCQFDVVVWVRFSSSCLAMPVAGVICPSPLQRFHEASPPPLPNITIASHLPWILSCSIATAHSHSIPFPFLQGPHKVNPNLFARDGLIIALACLSPSCTLHRDNRALLLIRMQLFILYFIYLDSESQWSLVSWSKLKQQLGMGN